jgi:dTDP-4-amino-4,6-dideoxygalactose transaminase
LSHPVLSASDRSRGPAPRGSDATSVPFLDLGREAQRLEPELLEACREVLHSGVFLFGPDQEQFEAKVAAATGAARCIAVASGTVALQVMLMAHGIGPGDEVITTAASFYSTAKAIAEVGATPCFADVDPVTYNLHPSAVEAAITPRTSAILAVHLYGLPADLSALRGVADRAGILLLEDAAQAFGAAFAGRPVGSWGDSSALSFYPTKNLGAVGDAGAVVTTDIRVADRARSIRFLGSTGHRDHFKGPGLSGRIDELQAAFLLVKLRHYAEALCRRQHLAARYDRLLPQNLVRQVNRLNLVDVRHLYVIRTSRRDLLRRSLLAVGIESRVHYAVPLHRQPLFRSLAAELPITDQWSHEVVSLPLYPDLTDGEQDRVIAAISESAAQRLTDDNSPAMARPGRI